MSHTPPPSSFSWPPSPESDPAQSVPEVDHQGDLRSAYRVHGRIATLVAVGTFTLFLLLSAFAPGFMTSRGTGNIPVGLLTAILLLPAMRIGVVLYSWVASRRIDPLVTRVRDEVRSSVKTEALR